jgi:hypothetical protein
MDYESFQAMSPEMARAYLDRFLEVERDAILSTVTLAAADGVQFDFSIQTLPDCLKWLVGKVRVHHVPLPEELPEWVKQSHPRGMTEFDDDSKTILLRASYYLGECFARLPGFSWTTGDPEYMEMNMPVVIGFADADALPAMVVVENMFLKIAADGQPTSTIDAGIAVWVSKCPARS